MELKRVTLPEERPFLLAAPVSTAPWGLVDAVTGALPAGTGF